MLIVLAAVMLLSQGVSSEPSVAPPAAAQAATPDKTKKPQLVCHREVVTGTIMSRRVCRTPEQVEADKLQAKRTSEALVDHLATCRDAGC